MENIITDKIQEIPAGLEKYLGTGKMVLPGKETIKNELSKLPEGTLITLPGLRANIASLFGVTTACPKSTLKTVREMMEDASSGAYRVVNGKGELVAKAPQIQSEMLADAGFDLDHTKSKPKVRDFKAFLVG